MRCFLIRLFSLLITLIFTISTCGCSNQGDNGSTQDEVDQSIFDNDYDVIINPSKPDSDVPKPKPDVPLDKPENIKPNDPFDDLSNNEISDDAIVPDIQKPPKLNIDEIEAPDGILNLYGGFDEGLNIEGLSQQLNKMLLEFPKNVSIILWRIDGSQALAYNTNQTYYSASTVKIAYAYSCCINIDNGNEQLDTLITYEEKHMHDGDGYIKNMPFGTQYSIAELIELCVSISDNVAYEMLLDHFGYDNYNVLMETIGCNSLKLSEGKLWARSVNPKEFLILWHKLSKYFSTSSPCAVILKASSTNTRSNYAIKSLDENIDYSHKHGDYYGARPTYSDAGIIWCEVPCIYVSFTNINGDKADVEYYREIMRLAIKIMGIKQIEEIEEIA